MNNITKYLKYISMVIGILGFIYYIRILMVGSIDSDKLEIGDTDSVERMESLSGIVGGFMDVTLWILVILIIIVLIFTVINLLKNPVALKKAIIAIVVLGILFAVSYMIADSGKVVTKAETIEAGSTSKLIEGGIWFSIILGAIAFVGFIFDSVKNLIK